MLRLPALPRRRLGFTLLELMLVLALLVVVTAIVWPAFEKPFATERLKRGADTVRAAWVRTRVQAMTSGVPHVFRFQAETGTYQIEPWGGLETEIEASSAEAFGLPEQTLEQEGLGSIGRGLPEGVVFTASEAMLDARTLATAAPAQASADGWSQPIFFYPDGTASTAQLLLRNEYELYIMLQLRGLTGVTTVSEVLSAEEIVP